MSSPIPLAQHDLPTLTHLSHLLHLFHHRNKNQHRRSIWYRHFSLLRKQLARLVTSLVTLHTAPTTNLARIRKKARDAELVANVEARLAFWRDVMVARWQRAFSQLVADGRFSVLGLVLLAVLGEVCKVVGITAEVAEMGQREVERVLEGFEREVGSGGGKGGDVEDVGEVVQRGEEWNEASEKDERRLNDDVKSFAKLTADTVAARGKKRKSEFAEKTTKKRKRRGDAIDDIFG